jgi:hypothetical protein
LTKYPFKFGWIVLNTDSDNLDAVALKSISQPRKSWKLGNARVTP